MLTDEEFRLFRNLIYEESGLYFNETKKDYLENRLMKRMKATHIATPYWYYRFVTANKKAEFLVLLDYLTVNETAFFRNAPQFELFRNIILPHLTAEKARAGRKKLRLWSAGCSTGEEAYSIGMSVLDAVPDADAWDVKIIASDISLKSLEIAHRGLYAEDKVRETVPERTRSRYFEPEDGAFRVADAIRRLVVFDYHNLKHENGMNGLDAVFCRNVMIYFDEEEQKRLVNKFYASLNPGGYLLLGHSESLHGWNMNFQFLYDNKGTAYQKPDEGGACNEDSRR